MITKIEKFSGTWCPPCAVLAKTLQKVLSEYQNIELIEYDSEENEELFKERNIQSVPQLFFYDEENVQVHHLSGAYPANKIKDIIDYHNRVLDTYDPYDKKYSEQ